MTKQQEWFHRSLIIADNGCQQIQANVEELQNYMKAILSIKKTRLTITDQDLSQQRI
jgi:hypothetical protein